MYGLGLGNATAAAVASSDVVLRETDLKIGLATSGPSFGLGLISRCLIELRLNQ